MGLFGPPDIYKLAARKNVSGLIKALGYERSEDRIGAARIRQQAAKALGKLGDGRAVTALVEALTGDDDRWVRIAAAQGLGKLGDRRAEAPLRALLEAGDVTIQAEAARALERIVGHEVAAASVAWRQSEAPEARADVQGDIVSVACPGCGRTYRTHSMVLNQVLRCQSCSKTFTPKEKE